MNDRLCQTCYRPFQPGETGSDQHCDRCAGIIRDAAHQIAWRGDPGFLAALVIITLTLAVILIGGGL